MAEFLGSGMAHFVEHLLGDRTEQYTKDELEAQVSALGGAYNAYTTKDHVCYHIAVRSEKVNDAIDHMEERVFHTLFPAETVENQRDIILNEIRMGQDEPGRQLWHAFYYAAFREHPARFPVIGYAENVARVSPADLETFYRRYYVPERAVVVVAGDVDAAATMAHLRETFGALPRGRSLQEPVFYEPPQFGPREVVIPMDVSAAYLWLGFRGPAYGTPDDYALDVLAAVAGAGRSSRLYKRVLAERGYVTNIEAWNTSVPSGANFLGIYAEGEAAELRYAEEAIVAEMLRFREKKVTREELARAKKIIRAQRELGLATVEDVAADLGLYELYMGNKDYGDKYLAAIDEVTADDVLAAARRYIREDNMTLAEVVPREWGRRPEGPTSTAVLEPMAKYELPNGVRLLVRRNTTQPTVAVHAVIAGGSRVAAPGKEGIAELAAELLVKGTRKRSADDIAREMEGMGAGLSAEAALDYLTLSTSCLSSDFERVFEVFSDCLTASTYPAAEFGKEQDRLLSRLQAEDDDWELAAEKRMRAVLYPHHPYRYLTTGTLDAVQRLTVADAYAYYEKYVTPSNVVVAVVGDVDPERVRRIGEKYLGEWYPPRSPEPIVPLDAAPVERKVVWEKTDNEQAVIYYGFATVKYGAEDEYALRMLDAALSGVFLPGGRLHTRLRGEGLVYVVHAFTVFGRDPGYFGIYAATAPDKAEKVVAIIDEELERIKSTPLTADEMALARENWLTMNALYNSQSNADVASLAARDELAGLGYNWRDKFGERISAVTAADVMNAARTYLVHPVVVITTPSPPGS